MPKLLELDAIGFESSAPVYAGVTSDEARSLTDSTDERGLRRCRYHARSTGNRRKRARHLVGAISCRWPMQNILEIAQLKRAAEHALREVGFSRNNARAAVSVCAGVFLRLETKSASAADTEGVQREMS